MQKSHQFKTRARYSEVDGMKRVHNSVYQVYFEEARVDLVRQNNYSYAKMEQEGLMFPVSEVRIKFQKAIVYDDEITINVTLEYLKQFSVKFLYRIVKAEGSVACEGYTVHAAINATTLEFMEISESIRNVFQSYLP